MLLVKLQEEMRSKTVRSLVPILLCTLVTTIYSSSVQAQALGTQKNLAKSLLPSSLALQKVINTSENGRTLRGNGEQDKLLGNSRNNRLHGLGNDLLIAGQDDGRSTFDTQLDPQYELLTKEAGIYFFGQIDQNRALLNTLLDVQGYAIAQVFDDPNTSFQAIGLSSKDGSKPPVLVFLGGSGDAGDLAAFFDPKGVSLSQFIPNKQAIKAWLMTITNDRQFNPQGFKPDITGISLGGALTQRTASEFPTLIGSAVSFISQGIDQETARKFIKNGGEPNQVRHYIVDGDPASLTGEAFIPGKVTVGTFEANEADRANYFQRKHGAGILADFQPFRSLIPENIDPSVTQAISSYDKPADLTLSKISVAELNQPNFTLKGKDREVGLAIVRASNPNFVIDRQHVEELRRSDREAFNKTFSVTF
jgi:hypothetical protein